MRCTRHRTVGSRGLEGERGTVRGLASAQKDDIFLLYAASAYLSAIVSTFYSPPFGLHLLTAMLTGPRGSHGMTDQHGSLRPPHLITHTHYHAFSTLDPAAVHPHIYVILHSQLMTESSGEDVRLVLRDVHGPVACVDHLALGVLDPCRLLVRHAHLVLLPHRRRLHHWKGPNHHVHCRIGPESVWTAVEGA